MQENQCRPRRANEDGLVMAAILKEDPGVSMWDSFSAFLIAPVSQWALLLLLRLKCKSRPKLRRVKVNNPTQSAESSEVDMTDAYFLYKYMHK